MISSAIYHTGKKHFFKITIVLFTCSLFFSCNDYFKNDYKDNSPTSGHLNVYYDEGLYLHLKNQAYTFESQYPSAHIHLKPSNDNDAVEALYKDSCEAIVISRLLNDKEKKAFASKRFDPKYSCLAYSGLAFVVNKNAAIKTITMEEFIKLACTENVEMIDTNGQKIKLQLLLDKNNSSLAQFVLDSVLQGKKLSPNVRVLSATLEALNYIKNNNNTIACIDFAWLSDKDDSITKHYAQHLKLLGIDKGAGKITYPSQSSFKLGDYPLTRKIYCYRKTGDFTLAKGFETYLAGPKGQMTFLKQGLLPYKQQERMVEVKFESLNTN